MVGSNQAADAAADVGGEAGGLPGDDVYLEFLSLVYERVPEAVQLVPIEDLLDLAKSALTEVGAE